MHQPVVFVATMNKKEYNKYVKEGKILKPWKNDGKRMTRTYRGNSMKNIKNILYLNSVIPKNSRFYKDKLSYAAPKFKDAASMRLKNKFVSAWRTFKSHINSPSKRTYDNPYWRAHVLRNLKSSNRKFNYVKKVNSPQTPLITSQVPNVPKNLHWVNFGTRKEALNKNGTTMYTYFPNRNVLRIKNKHGTIKNYRNAKSLFF